MIETATEPNVSFALVDKKSVLNPTAEDIVLDDLSLHALVDSIVSDGVDACLAEPVGPNDDEDSQSFSDKLKAL